MENGSSEFFSKCGFSKVKESVEQVFDTKTFRTCINGV